MLNFFRKNLFNRSVLLLLYVTILRVPSFLEDGLQDSNGIVGAWLIQNFDLRKWWFDLICLLLIFVQATILNRIVIENRIMKEIVLFPGVFYILLISSIPGFYDLTPLIIGMTFLLISVSNLLHIYKKHMYIAKLFNAGLWLGVAFLFHYSFIFFVMYGLTGLFILRSFKPVEGLRFLIGFFIPLFLLLTGLFWTDHLDIFVMSLSESNLGLVSLREPFGILPLIVTLFFASLIICSIFFYNQLIKKKNIQAVKKIDLSFWGLVIAGLAVLFIQFPMFQWWLFAVPFLALFCAMLFLAIEKIVYAELLHALWIIVTFVFYYIYTLN